MARVITWQDEDGDRVAVEPVAGHCVVLTVTTCENTVDQVYLSSSDCRELAADLLKFADEFDAKAAAPAAKPTGRK